MSPLPDIDLPAAKVFGYFFTLSFAMLGLIVLIGLVGKLSQIRRCLRQMIARRTRKHRMLADKKKLLADGLKLEGIYFFEETEASRAGEEDYAEGRGRRASDAA